MWLNRISGRTLDALKVHKKGLIQQLFPSSEGGVAGGVDARIELESDAADASSPLGRHQHANAIIATIPGEWDVSVAVRNAWSELICRRAIFVADSIHQSIDKVAPWFGATGE